METSATSSNINQQQPTTTTVYVVLENGELYPSLYYSYEAAREAVITKYADEIQSQREEAEEMGSICMSSSVDIDENESGTTLLYIEKEINITIQRYRVLCPTAPCVTR